METFIAPFNPKFSAVPFNSEWLYKVEKAAPMPIAPVKGTRHSIPVPSQYNAMLHPLMCYAIRRVDWYKSDRNVSDADYRKHLQILGNDRG